MLASSQERSITVGITKNLDQSIYNEKLFWVITENAQINKIDDLFMPVGAERAFRSVQICLNHCIHLA